MLFRDIVCFVILCGKSFGGFDGFGESTVEFNSLMVLVNLIDGIDISGESDNGLCGPGEIYWRF